MPLAIHIQGVCNNDFPESKSVSRFVITKLLTVLIITELLAEDHHHSFVLLEGRVGTRNIGHHLVT